MSHALVIGEALVDIVHATDGTIREHPGGSPANVALGLARLGRTSRLATWVGRDVFGELVMNHLHASGVELVPGSDGAERTSTALASLDAAGAATYEFDLRWSVPEVHLDDDVVALHAGSIAATLRPGADAVAEIAAAAQEYATVTYDVNVRPSIMGEPDDVRGQVERMIERSDIVKSSDEDIAWFHPDLDPIDAARGWLERGPAVVLVTRGGQGSVAVTAAGHRVEVPSPAVQIADTVGAGDSYMSGLIDGLWSADLLGAARRDRLRAITEEQVRTAMAWAARIAAITVSRPGADPPGRAEVAP